MVDVTMPTSDFLTAGLDTEGIYRLRFKSLKVEEKTVKKEGPRKGDKFKMINGQVDLIEHFGEGMLEYPIHEYISFFTNGNQLERFRKLYVAAFETVPEATPGSISIGDLASALVGNDTVWTALYWRRNRDTDEPEQVLGWDFSQDPSTLKGVTPFADRDEQTIKAAALALEADGTAPVEAYA